MNEFNNAKFLMGDYTVADINNMNIVEATKFGIALFDYMNSAIPTMDLYLRSAQEVRTVVKFICITFYNFIDTLKQANVNTEFIMHYSVVKALDIGADWIRNVCNILGNKKKEKLKKNLLKIIIVTDHNTDEKYMTKPDHLPTNKSEFIFFNTFVRKEIDNDFVSVGVTYNKEFTDEQMIEKYEKYLKLWGNKK